jgi:hypothetical protein
VYSCVSYFARHGQKNNTVVGAGSRVEVAERCRGTGGEVGGKADLLVATTES